MPLETVPKMRLQKTQGGTYEVSFGRNWSSCWSNSLHDLRLVVDIRTGLRSALPDIGVQGDMHGKV